MEKIAWIAGTVCIYWSGIIRALAAAAGIFTFLALYLKDRSRVLSCAVGIPLAGLLSLLLSRAACWWFRQDSYGSLAAALDLRNPGDAALMGVFAGCLLAAAVLIFAERGSSLPELLDCLAIALCLGIALGRLGCFFNNADRGMIVNAAWGLPWADTLVNPVSGSTECRLATFLLQAMAAGVLFPVLLGVYLWQGRGKKGRQGDAFFLFLLLYGAAQAVLDSTRYDALYLRSNGFIRVVQLLGVGAMLAAGVWFTPRPEGKRQVWACAGVWVARLACLALAGYMEYYVQRHADRAAMAYSCMSAALGVWVLLTLMYRPMVNRIPKFPQNTKNPPDTV